MLGNFKILTLSHHNCPTDQIRYFLIPQTGNQLYEDLDKFKTHHNLSELLYLNTCNRGMYFFYTQQSVEDLRVALYNLLYAYHGEQMKQIWNNVEVFEGKKAIEHYMSVAASMNSMVIGEREIFRQIREAYELCHANKLTGDHLRLIQKQTVKTAKRIYTDSKIGEKPVSVVSLAMKKFEEQQLSKDSGILLIGAGTTIESVSRFLKKGNYNNVHVFNRTLGRAEVIAGLISPQAKAYALEDLNRYQGQFRCIITCTSAPSTILTRERYESLLGEQKDKKILVDLSVPQDIDPSIYDDYPTTKISLGELKVLAKRNHALRSKELAKASLILKEEMEAFTDLVHRRFIERSFSGLPREIRKVREKAVNEVFADDLASLDDHAKETIDKILDYMEKKCVAVPMKTAKEQYIKIKATLHSTDRPNK